MSLFKGINRSDYTSDAAFNKAIGRKMLGIQTATNAAAARKRKAKAGVSGFFKKVGNTVAKPFVAVSDASSKIINAGGDAGAAGLGAAGSAAAGLGGLFDNMPLLIIGGLGIGAVVMMSGR